MLLVLYDDGPNKKIILSLRIFSHPRNRKGRPLAPCNRNSVCLEEYLLCRLGGWGLFQHMLDRFGDKISLDLFQGKLITLHKVLIRFLVTP
jgi:hypothetical protein